MLKGQSSLNMEFSRFLAELFSENPGKTVGALTGLTLGILILVFGFLKILVIIIFMILGIIIGKMVDDRSSVIDTITGFFRRR
jgi:uncharacterized membrane protein